MKKNYKKIMKKFTKNMDLLVDLKMSLNLNFVMICIIHKMLGLTENNLNYLKYSIFKCFLRSIIDFQFFLKKYFFHNI